MSSINDVILQRTGGNSVNDGLASWYSKTGNESIQDAEFRWLSTIDVRNGNSISDMWYNILTDAGFSGALTDMKKKYWESSIIFPSELSDVKLWTRYNSGITVTGSGVSQWDDQSGNSNHLKQGTDLDRPQEQSDGSILTDGIRQFLKADAFTFSQPEEIFILGKQVTWTSDDRWFDGNIANSGTLDQVGATPQLKTYAGSFITNSISIPLDTYGVVTSVFNSTSSLLQLDNGIPSTAGTTGTGNMGGFTLGARGDGNDNYANIQVKEIVAVGATLTTVTRAGIIAYLQNL